MRWLRPLPLLAALCAAGALALAAGRASAEHTCLGWFVFPGAREIIPVVLALCMPLGLAVVAGPRWPRWVAGAVLLLAGVVASLSEAGFLTAAAATVLVALVLGVRRAQLAPLFAVAAVALAVLTVRYVAHASDACRAMSDAVAVLPVLDARCTITTAEELPPIPAAPPLPPEIVVRCRDGRAELTAVPVKPMLPLSLFLRWSYDRERGEWRLVD